MFSNLEKKYEEISLLKTQAPIFWQNTNYIKDYDLIKNSDFSMDNVIDARERLKRFSKYFISAFPETKEDNGLIESPIYKIDNIKNKLIKNFNGNLYLKADSELKISGSIKARGGIYEVLKFAEEIAINNNMITINDDYIIFNTEKFKSFFSNYSIAVGSTGNLGLSIGIISAKLGFKVDVHMSNDAKKWKKDKLRSLGVNVIEYESDYSVAVENGRKIALNNPLCHFVDDESSIDLFLGYSVAGQRLKDQLMRLNITINKDHPLFVYLPCGVGGGPGGVTFGLKLAFGENVYPIFAEPTNSPCMMLSVMTGLNENISVNDIGLTNITLADGLAVGRASGLVSKTLSHSIAGFYTTSDDRLKFLLKEMYKEENIFLEPSALIGLEGPNYIFNSIEGKTLINKFDLTDKMNNSIHIVWATGGSMVPKSERELFLK
ncbi:D-serine ammonia-lyase [Helicovermis profundi]|uniref:Probable D-serine dehydratase n=1 Tax=Helicovermis profundi TaxID=3065157 RepID=A0AAU9E4F0_9FIRM|nr:D-serine ammonia-lyase [Clostridia bacterium S502]